MSTKFKYDVGFQYRILALALSHEDSLRNLISIIEPKYFTTSILIDSWKILSKYYGENMVMVSPESLCVLLAKLKTKTKKRKYQKDEIEELKQYIIKPITDKEVVLEEVQSFCKQAAFLLTISNSVDDILNNEYDTLYNDLQELFSKDFSQSNIGFDYFEEVGRLYLEDGTTVARKGIIGTGFELDKQFKGGLGKKEMGIIIGPSGRGKSAALLNIAYQALMEGKNVLYISCELSKETIADRFSRIIMGNLKQVEEFLPMDLVLVLRKVKEKIGSKLFIEDYEPGELTVAKTASILRNIELQREVKIDLLIVDYLGEMKLPKADREDQAYKHLATALRGLAYKFDIVVWSAHQASRGSHDKMIVRQDDISDSFAIFRPLDIAFSISSSPIEFAAGYCRLTILKNRFGPVEHTCVCKFSGVTQRFLPTTIEELIEQTEEKAHEIVMNAGVSSEDDD